MPTSRKQVAGRVRTQPASASHQFERSQQSNRTWPASEPISPQATPKTPIYSRKTIVRNRIIAGSLALLVIFSIVWVVDAVSTAGRAYSGVRIGTVDVSGMNAEEMAAALNSAYTEPFNASSVAIFASEEAAARTEEAIQNKNMQDSALAEQMAVDEARANKEAWQVTASSLGGSYDIEDAISRALAVGRSDGGAGKRLSSLLFGSTVDIEAALDNALVENLASEIDGAIGEERIDYGIALNDGIAYVTQGADGYMVNRDTLAGELLARLTDQSSSTSSIVAHAEYAPVRIDEQTAKRCASNVTSIIARGIDFTCDGVTWSADASQVGKWITASVVEQDGCQLRVAIDSAVATQDITRNIDAQSDAPIENVAFERSGDDIAVKLANDTKVPNLDGVADELSRTLFGDGGTDGMPAAPEQTPSVNLESKTLPEELSFDEAVSFGVIGEIASYTTRFTTGSGTENRNHNIELVSHLLDRSIIGRGQEWSYNDTTGDCDESKGFLGAGAIVAGEYTDSVGGGICQVATTVFNAVYESGLPITERHNHSLYIASYPQGRDAAVTYPEMDLRWQNDTASDVLLRVSTESGRVTATLYGVDPGYTVTTQTGEWEEGASYKTTTTVDESLAPGTKYVKTRGSDGSTIDVIRTVSASDGSIVRRDRFASVYDPINEVIVTGPESAAGSSST